MARVLARIAAVAAVAAAVTVCGEQGSFGGGGVVGPTGDTEPPRAQLSLADTLVELTDSLKFTAVATDNNRLKSVRVEITGLGGFLFSAIKDTTFATTNVTAYTEPFVVPLPPTATGQRLRIAVTAIDQADLVGTATDTVRVIDELPPALVMLQPAASLRIGAGDTLRVVARAQDPSGIRVMGGRVFYRDSVLDRVVPLAADSEVYASRFTTRTDTFLVVVPDTLKPGDFLVHAFAADSSPTANDTLSPDVSIAVRDVRLPFGTFVSPAVDSQVVAGDSVRVVFRAQDLTGLDSVVFRGYRVRGDSSLGTDTLVLRFQPKRAALNTRPDSVVLTRWLLPVYTDSTAEDSVYLEARLHDVGGNRATVLRRIRIVQGPSASVSSPADSSLQPVGVPLLVTVSGRDPDSLAYLGYRASGVVTAQDSFAVAPRAVTASGTLALPVPATAALGSQTIRPFGRDRFGNLVEGRAVTVRFTDTQAPSVTLVQPSTVDFPVSVGDSVLVRVRVQDNRGVSQVVISGEARRGVDSLGTATSVARFASWTVPLAQETDTTFSRYLRAITADSTSERVYVVARARDSSGNVSADTITVRLVSGPRVETVRPAEGTVTSAGKSVIIELRAIDPQGVRILGWRTSGILVRRDSVIAGPVAGNLRDTLVFVDTLTIPGATPVGTFTLVPFASDSLGDPSGTVPGVSVSVQSVAGDVTPPTVEFDIGLRIEVDDSITVRATDAGGIRRVGYILRNLAGALLRRDSTVPDLPGTLSDVAQRFGLNIPGTSFPLEVRVQAFAVDSIGNRFTTEAETLTVVAGRTYALPPGSQIGDAVYNANRRELYLSNVTLGRIEVFSLAVNSFVASIPVGSRPLGLAMWPRDTLGGRADTLIVANSGGTNLSLVNLVGRREFRRHRLPNYIIQKVKTRIDDATGMLALEITEYDYSDRPQYVGAVCRAGATTPCDSVLAVYSTTPTAGQTGFPEQGYVAWENLMPGARSSHFFWEPAVGAASSGTDTLQVISSRDSVPGQLVRDTLLGGGVGVTVDFATLQFQDSTFVRNSGNFLRALVGEGGVDDGFARVLTFDPRAGMTTIYGDTLSCSLLGYPLKCSGVEDLGVSPSVYVRDFIANRASTVSSVAINHDGRTMLVRADSIYVFDRTLRQTGIIEAGGGAVGMDLHPNHRFDANVRGTGGLGGTGSPSDRMVFTARPDSSVDVFDTFFYGQVTDTTALGATIPVPIRNALMGPVRVATDLGNVVMFGLTSYGLVSVRLPSVTNSLFPVNALPPPVAAPLAPLREDEEDGGRPR